MPNTRRKPSVSLLLAAAFLGASTASSGEAWAACKPVHSAKSFNQNATGTITGRVAFEGPRPKPVEIRMTADRVCASLHPGPVYAQDGEVNSNGTLPNVFVFVKAGAERYSFNAPKNSVTLDQVGCEYQPHVLGIMVGQRLKVVNSDPTVHNTRVSPEYNRPWNQTQLPGGAPFYKAFTRPEIMIPVFCNQHPWMKAYIGVTTNPFHAVTGPEGTFTLKGIPAGEYTLEAWTATFGTQERNVTVRPKETATVDFTFHAH